MIQTINGVIFRKMIIEGATILEDNKKFVDSLNVFPVPDGDTGTNMSMTMRSVVNEIQDCNGNDIKELCNKISRGALKGARGNSGVILSQILKGMCNTIRDEKEINTKIFAKAIVHGSEKAREAVTVPKEGTILTVMSSMADASSKYINKRPGELSEFLKHVIDTGDEALQRTPELLPVLKKAGVVDSGGQGLMIIFSGFLKILAEDTNSTVKASSITTEYTMTSVIPNPEVNYENLADIIYGYCTEFMIIEMKKKTTLADIDKLRQRLMSIGDSVICLGDLSLVKVHVHTNEPNLALGMALELGELNNLKIENMREENRELKRKAKAKKKYAIVSVCTGDGFKNIFSEIGVESCIDGGQSMNPSASDIADAIEKANADNVFVLPNNKNIIMAAKQTKDLVKANVIVIETTSIPQGIAACLEFNSEAELDENIEAMKGAITRIRSGAVTYSVKDTKAFDFDIKSGDIIGLDEHNIVAKGYDLNKTVEKLVEKLDNDDITNISLYYGDGVTEEEANELNKILTEKYTNKDIMVTYGGQSVYYYVLSLE